jgi:hypothetical protein
MFQETIHDLLALAGSGPRAEDILDCLRSRIIAFETFEYGEIVARSQREYDRFVFAPGLDDIGEKILEDLGDEPTLRIDSAEQIRHCGYGDGRGLSSLLILRLEAEPFLTSALVLGHRRAWSFAAAPLFRLRTLGTAALRMLASLEEPEGAPGRTRAAEAETTWLRKRITDLEAEIIGLRTERSRSPS